MWPQLLAYLGSKNVPIVSGASEQWSRPSIYLIGSPFSRSNSPKGLKISGRSRSRLHLSARHKTSQLQPVSINHGLRTGSKTRTRYKMILRIERKSRTRYKTRTTGYVCKNSFRKVKLRETESGLAWRSSLVPAPCLTHKHSFMSHAVYSPQRHRHAENESILHGQIDR